MCNLYSMTRGQEAMRRLFAVERDLIGNLPPLPGIFPDYLAPIVRIAQTGGKREARHGTVGHALKPQGHHGRCREAS